MHLVNANGFYGEKNFFIRCFILAIGLGFSSGNAAGVQINELMPSNRSGRLDPDFRQFTDWIELHNTGASSVSLAGYRLTDDRGNPSLWTFPSGASIPGNGYLVVYADGNNTNRSALHTAFKLNAGGEAVWLFNASGTAVDSVEYEGLPADVSFGRQADGSPWVYFADPTPGSANGSGGIAEKLQLSVPEFSLPGGLYPADVSVSLSHPATGAVIRYATDGSMPVSSSAAYGAPLVLSQTTVVRARAFKPGFLPSEPVTRTYLVREDVHLPVVSIAADPTHLFDSGIGIYVDANIAQRRDWERPASVECWADDGKPWFSAGATLQLFGNTAIYIPEKSFDVQLDDPLAFRLFPSKPRAEFDAFILRSSSDDWGLTMFRDGMIQLLLRDFSRLDFQAYRPAAVFLDGEYWGIHNFREKVDADFVAAAHGVDPDAIDMVSLDLRTDAGTPLEIDAGDRSAYDALVDFFASSDPANEADYQAAAAMIDVDNFIDWAVLQTFIGNASWRHNIRMWRPHDPKGRWQWLVFDLDRGYGNNFSADKINTHTLNDMADNYPVLNKLLRNPGFLSLFVARCVRAMNTTFAPDRVVSVIDSLQEDLRAEMPRHIERWRGHCGSQGGCGIASMEDWEANVEFMRTFARQRVAAMQEHLQSRFGLPGTARLSVRVSPPGGGGLTVDSAAVEGSVFTGGFFSGTRVSLAAEPADGYTFAAWKGAGNSETLLVPRGSAWNYRARDHEADAGWTTAGFNDDSWTAARARLGYGGDGEVTEIPFGPDAANKWPTAYFRLVFSLPNPSVYTRYVARLARDDGAVVYVNGSEVFRSNMPDGAIAYTTWSRDIVSGDAEKTFFETEVDPSFFRQGNNLIAVEVHQCNAGSSDLGFDLELAAFGSGPGSVVLSTSPDYGVEAAGNRELTAEFELLAANRLPASVTTDSLLTADHSPYVATRDLVIRPGAKLIVNAGVELRFQAGASLVVQGALSVYGREGKPVRLQAADPSRPWGALCFQNTTDSCVLNWTEVTGATHGPDSAVYKAAVSAVGSVLLLDHVSIGPSPQPFYGRNGRITLRRCSLDGTEAGDDILNVQVALCTIEDSYFFGEGELDFDSVDGGVIRNTRVRSTSVNNNRDCVDIGASQNVLLENNVVEEGSDKGFSIGEGSTVTLRGNTVAGCLRGIAVKDNSFARIDRNTIYGCVTGLDLYEKTPGLGGGRATVTNTVFSGSSEADIKTDALSSVLVTYSLSDRLVFQGEGNRKGDPLFKAPAQLDFRLRPGSPCIDTGDPAAIRDPDGTRADMGAMPYNAALGRYGRLSINEVMAQNASFACDEKWEYDDWIEIYNGSASPVDMGGLYLTDDIRRPFLSRIPDGEAQSTTVPAGGYRVLWADGDTAQGPMHLGFRLSGTGESVVLIAMDGAVALVLDSLRFGRQTADASFGRVPDGAGPGDKLMNPTPGWTNLGGGDAAFRLVSPSQDTTVSLPENSGSAVVFRWTRPDLPDASLAGARFVLSVDNLTAGTSVLDTVAETSRTLAFAPGTDGRLRWRVLALLADGRVLVSDQRRAALGSPASADPAIAVPDRFMLLPPYPNPFNPSVTIRFALPGRADVRLVVYDVQGRCVRELVRCAVPAGFHDAEWDGKDASGLTVSSGIYILKLTAGNRSAIRKATLLR